MFWRFFVDGYIWRLFPYVIVLKCISFFSPRYHFPPRQNQHCRTETGARQTRRRHTSRPIRDDDRCQRIRDRHTSRPIRHEQRCQTMKKENQSQRIQERNRSERIRTQHRSPMLVGEPMRSYARSSATKSGPIKRKNTQRLNSPDEIRSAQELPDTGAYDTEPTTKCCTSIWYNYNCTWGAVFNLFVMENSNPWDSQASISWTWLGKRQLRPPLGVPGGVWRWWP